MNLSLYLQYEKIENLGYDTSYQEEPTSKLIDFDWKNILDPPPTNTDRKTIKELELISKLTKNRSNRDIELLLSIDQDLDSPFISLLEKYGIKYPQNYIDLFYNIIKPVLYNIKSYWNRPRPRQLANLYGIDIDVIHTNTHHTASYPSGHTVYTNLVSLIIQDLFNQINKQELKNIVAETAKARVVQGVHYPSDNEASLVFSQILFDKLQPKLRKYYNETI